MASGSRLLAEQRRRKILEFIEHKGQITVRELASRFSVSAVTARGDLDSLCSSGLAIRSHGGAVRKLETGSDGGTSSRESRKFADVARLAKVSLKTVSRVAQGNSKLAPSVQASVLAVARDLGVNLASGAANRTIMFILGNRETVNEFQSKVLLGAEGYCTRQDWALQFISFRSDLNAPLSSLSLPEILTSSNRPSGVILSGTHSANILAWYIGNQRLPWFARCARGYRQAMKEADLEPRFSEIGSEDRELGYLAVKALLASGERPTALFVGTDQAASGVYQALQESGIRIPDDISVAGFNDTIGEVLHPGLTTVREFPKELGVHLAEFAIRRIQEPTLPPQQLIMPTELIRRESVRQIAPGHSYASSFALQEHTL